MPRFSKRSLENLKTCHPDLIKIANEAIKRIDFTIIEGHRSKEKQKENLKKGVTQTLNSKHCEYPSKAFDFIPYPFKDWDDTKSFNKVGEIILQCAKELNILARRGADWNMNGRTDDEKFYDGPHIELLTLEEFKRINFKIGGTKK